MPEYRNGIFRLPLYAREGVIIPMMFVDDKTMNIMGIRSDGSIPNELIAKVFAFDLNGKSESEFILYEDDGETIEYQNGKVRTNRISQKRVDDGVIKVTVHGSYGTYNGAPGTRNNLIRLVAENVLYAQEVTLNGESLARQETLDNFNAAGSGWINSGKSAIMAKSGTMAVDVDKEFIFHVREVPCKSEFRSISIPGEGNGWRAADPDRTLSCEREKIWQGRVRMTNEEYKFAADGSWQVNWGSNGLQDGPNFPAIALSITHKYFSIYEHLRSSWRIFSIHAIYE